MRYFESSWGCNPNDPPQRKSVHEINEHHLSRTLISAGFPSHEAAAEIRT